MKKDKEAVLKKAYEMGFYYSKEYKGCSQSVIAAIQDALGIEGDAAFDAVFKSATCMAGGLCSTGTSACGALSGGVIAIGYIFGRERSNFRDPQNIRLKARDIAMKLHNKFMEYYGGSICRDVQKKIFGRSFDLLNPADREAFEAAGAHSDKCPSVVANAARWATEIILEQEGIN
ncbi:MAG: C-GCAxxG-C-C family protein [Dehalococcoidales bacterium]|nr:C-GCAxxG-C-C family protein [Dehalococcoidales bacterium]